MAPDTRVIVESIIAHDKVIRAMMQPTIGREGVVVEARQFGTEPICVLLDGDPAPIWYYPDELRVVQP